MNSQKLLVSPIQINRDKPIGKVREANDFSAHRVNSVTTGTISVRNTKVRQAGGEANLTY
jgi:hypothetical protein